MALIHLDAGVLIGFLDADDTHHLVARTAIADAIDRGDLLAMAASALVECLVGPARRGEEAIGVVHRLRLRLPIEIVPLDADIATTAATVRAGHRSLRLPGALVIATASVGRADRLLTTDRRWPSSIGPQVGLAIRLL